LCSYCAPFYSPKEDESETPNELDDRFSNELDDRFSDELRQLISECVSYNPDSRPDTQVLLKRVEEQKSNTPPSDMQFPSPRDEEVDDNLQNSGEDMAQTTLHWAVIRGEKEMVKVLLQIGADVDQKDRQGRTALWWAVNKDQEATAELLLENKATFDTDSSGGLATLLTAIEKGYIGLVQRLLERGAPVNEADENGKTPLQVAAGVGNLDMLVMLLDRKADPKAEDSNCRTALHEAAANGFDEVVRRLMITGVIDVDAHDDDGRTPLHEAAAMGSDLVVIELLAHHADINALDKTLRTALHIAIDEPQEGVEMIINLLLEKGAQVDGKDANGSTVLHKVVDKGLEAVTARTLACGAKSLIDEKDQEGRTALHIAASRGLRRVVRMLVDAGASILELNHRGQMPLHEAMKRSPRLTKANRWDGNWVGLLIGTPDQSVLKTQDNEGNTPLHIAAINGAKADLVLELSNACQDATFMINKEGQSPYKCLRISMDSPATDDARKALDTLKYNYVRYKPSYTLGDSPYSESKGMQCRQTLDGIVSFNTGLHFRTSNQLQPRGDQETCHDRFPALPRETHGV
jgi:ankyrin repeat protein